MGKIFFLIVLFVPAISLSQDSKTTYVKSGDTVPYSGILLNAQAQAEILAQKDFDKKKCELDSQYGLLKEKANCDLNTGKLKIDLDTINKKYEIVTKLKDDEIQRVNTIALKESSKSNTWIWYFIGGLAMGVGATVGISYAVSH